MNKLTKEELMKLYNEGKNLSDKPIFIDFYADWWGPCRMFSSVLDDVTPEYTSKMNMYKVDIEEEPEIAGLFGVRSLPTISLISKDGKVNTVLGSLPEDTLKYYLDGLLISN